MSPVIEIDGRKVVCAEGASVLSAARMAGIEIPALCSDPRLEPHGGCRLCIVRIDGSPRLQPACATAVREGMVVLTDDEEITAIRRGILELLLSDHPADCLMCDRSGDCLLQDLAYELGVDPKRFQGSEHRRPALDDNPYIYRDYDKCVLCGRCVNICREIQGWGCYDFIGRGFETIVGTAFEEPLDAVDCELCGQCISACPVGALSERASSGKGRSWQFQKVRTVCPYCGVGCVIELRLRNGKVIGVETPLPDRPDAGPNAGNLCVKGRFATEFIHHSERLTHPLIREGGTFRRATWEEVLDLVAKGLWSIREEHGPDALAGLSSAKCTNEENYLFQKLFRAAIGTNNVDHCARLCHASTVTGLAECFGSGAMTNSIADLAEADAVFIIGSNTTEAHPVIALSVRKALRNGAKLIIADPRAIDLADVAELHLKHKPGSDIQLVNGMMLAIIEAGLTDEEFIAGRTEGFPALKEHIISLDKGVIEEETGVDWAQIEEAARLYATAERASTLFAMGITQHACGTGNVRALADLVMMTGNIGRPGTGLNPLRGQNNVQGACDMGALPNLLPGYRAVTDEASRERFAAAWWRGSLPGEPGLTLTRIIHSPEVRGLLIMGENPAVSDPDTVRVRADLAGKEFLVVIDMFMTETAELADVVLPAASFAEKIGTFTNTERRVQLLQAAVPSPGEARADWWILASLASRLGLETVSEPAAVFDEIASLVPQYGGMSHARLREEGGLQWPCPNAGHPGTPILHVDAFARGVGKFSVVETAKRAEEPDAQYPFMLTTGRIRWQYHTRTMTGRSALDDMAPRAFVEINCADAETLGIAFGDQVKVKTRRGELELPAEVSDVVRPGVIFIPFHYAEAPANTLTTDILDPVSGIPELKCCAASVEKA